MQSSSTNKKKLLANFVKLIIKEFSLKSTFLVTSISGDPDNIPDRGNIEILDDKSFFEDTLAIKNVAPDYDIKLDNKPDFIFGDLPLGLMTHNGKQPFDIKLRINWLIVYNLLKNLSDEGIGLFLLEPNFKQTIQGEEFLKRLEQEGFFLNAIFNTPENILASVMGIRPILGLFSRTKSETLFIAELNDELSVADIVHNFKNQKTTKSVLQGEIVQFNEFETFSNHEISRQIRVLSSQYKDFKEFTLDEISLEINATKGEHEIRENAIYIPLIGTLVIYTDIKDLDKKHQNYYQIVLDKNVALSGYLNIYFNSQLGQLSLSSLLKGSYISRINKQDINQIIVPIPPVDQQRSIIKTEGQLVVLEQDIFELKKELSLNPNNAELINERIEGVLEVFGKLTTSDRIISMIRKGESKTVEFKETFSKDIRTGKREKYIEESSLKNIVAFLNSDGGTLIIGVTDASEIVGIEKDIYASDDKYLLHFKNSIKERIGAEFYPLIDYSLISIEGIKVLIVTCLISDKPVFLDEKEFYVRTNPAADKLEGRKLQEYINNHFKK